MCIDIKFVGVVIDLSWRIGHCNSGMYADSLRGPFINTYRCCLTPGKHVLTCEARGQFHWRQGYVLLQGRKYCQDFIGFKALRRITIFCKQTFYVQSNNRIEVNIIQSKTFKDQFWCISCCCLYNVKKYVIVEYARFQLRRC